MKNEKCLFHNKGRIANTKDYTRELPFLPSSTHATELHIHVSEK